MIIQIQEVIQNLYKEMGKDKQKLNQTLELLGKLIKNVCDNPNEDKFRSFRKVFNLNHYE